MSVFSSDGTLRFAEELRSGGATGRSWPAQIASHTESKGVNDPRIQCGDRLVFENATLPPCPGCRGNMNNMAAAKGLVINYSWTDSDGKSGTWSTNPKKASKAIKSRNARKKCPVKCSS